MKKYKLTLLRFNIHFKHNGQNFKIPIHKFDGNLSKNNDIVYIGHAITLSAITN